MWEDKVEFNFAVDLADRLRKARAQVEGHIVESEPKVAEPKLLPAPVEANPVAEAVPRPKVVQASREEPEDWVAKLL